MWGMVVGLVLAAGRTDAEEYAGLGAAEGGGGMRIVLIPCSCASIESARLTLARAVMPCRGSTVATPNQSRNGSTHWVIPMASAFSCIIYHTVSSARKGETNIRWTREKGARDEQGTETLYVLGVSWGRWGCPGAMRANKAYISAAGGTTMSTAVNHSGCTTTVAGRRPRRMFLAKARNFPSSGAGCAKYGVRT